MIDLVVTAAQPHPCLLHDGKMTLEVCAYELSAVFGHIFIIRVRCSSIRFPLRKEVEDEGVFSFICSLVLAGGFVTATPSSAKCGLCKIVAKEIWGFAKSLASNSTKVDRDFRTLKI